MKYGLYEPIGMHDYSVINAWEVLQCVTIDTLFCKC